MSQGDLFGTSSAVLSDDGVYRYRLDRTWDPRLGRVLWVMLNPSTADATEDDPTIRKCKGFANRWGYGAITVVNLFAFRATDPQNLCKAAWPISEPDHRNGRTVRPLVERNDYEIVRAARECDLRVMAWGANRHPCYPDRDRAVAAIIRDTPWIGPGGPQLVDELHCLGTTADGHPRHPGRLAYETVLAEWEPTR